MPQLLWRAAKSTEVAKEVLKLDIINEGSVYQETCVCPNPTGFVCMCVSPFCYGYEPCSSDNPCAPGYCEIEAPCPSCYQVVDSVPKWGRY